jgi:PDZ domain
MTQTQVPNRLHKQMADVVALEAAIAQALDQLIMESANHPEVTAMLREFHTMTKGQLYALDTRLQTLADNVPIPDRTAAVCPDGESSDGNTYPVSTALQTAYILFNRVLIEYAALQVLAIRFGDGWVVAEAGTAAHLARQHTQNYVHAMQQIARVLHDVVVWELDHEGLACQCICPSCSAGICLCAAASRVTLSHAWTDDGPIAVDAGVYVQLPRKGSAAANAGLRKGDVVVGVDGKDVKPISDLQTAIREHQSGEPVHLKVRRGPDELKDITIIRP